ncbi:hypothetical protein J421_0435 [Gemmatirosa kalamazoonensis]|jgi:hypothetical protein|uniref:Outer membrane protein beta-barrel domain-containing protein n=1 Tax=Gemmatirosa kalamazoonensis TaxID=861299 RepID=W0RBZ4_9BACT|nr:hypothetical protein [Gemmatirosa kalamazoonensis]AHG87972.1 hypothetical protein J421_0435 [Gemmatirosa kalamazoonensis]
MRMDVGRIAALSAVLLALAPAGAQAQRRLLERRSLEVFGARYALADKIGTDKSSLDGVGARLQFERYDPDRPARSLWGRTRGGLFAAYTTSQGRPELSTLHVGVQTDASVLPQPLGGAVDPFISFGIGVFHTSRQNLLTQIGNGRRIRRTDFAFTPAVGTRIGMVDRFGARVDLRAPFVFGTSTTANFVAEGGIYFSF